LVAVSCLDSFCILGQCIMNIKHNLLYTTWTAGLRRRTRLLKKRQNAKETCKIRMYYQHRQGLWRVTRQTTPVLREDAPWQTKPESGHESWRSSVPRQTGWPTDRLTVSCKVTLIHHHLNYSELEISAQ
jgi:hypothetical protein